MMLQTRGEGVPLGLLARDLKVSARTIQRDFELLQELGVPLEYEEDAYSKRYWRLPPNFLRTGPFTFGLKQAVALHLAGRMLHPFDGTLFTEGLQECLDRVRAVLPAEVLDYFATLDEVIEVRSIGRSNYRSKAATVRVLTEAIRGSRAVRLAYRSLWSRSEYQTYVDPYGLVVYVGDLYLVGHSHRANSIRTFKVTRIETAESTHKTFSRPRGFSLEEHFKSSFGIVRGRGRHVDIKVRFTGTSARLVGERDWHDSQVLTWAPLQDSLFGVEREAPRTLFAQFRLTDTIEFKRWIKGFGAQAEIIAPQWLRREMHAELLAATGVYES